MFEALVTDFASKLSITDPSQIDVLGDFLKGIDIHLTSKGLIWTTDNTTSQKDFYSDYDEYRSVFITFPFQKTNSVIKIKNLDDDTYSLTLTEKKDYLLTQHNLETYPVFGVTLRKNIIASPYYLEISAVWKFGDELPSDLVSAVLNLASEYMGIFNQNLNNQKGSFTKSTSIDEVSFSFGEIKTQNLSNYANYKKVLSRYL